MAREIINPDILYDPPGYSHIAATTGGRLIHIAGQVAIDADANMVGRGDFEAQVRESFANLTAALEAVGATTADLVKTTMYVIGLDADKLGILRGVRREFFGDVEPATSTLLGVSALAGPDLLFEVDAVAVVG